MSDPRIIDISLDERTILWRNADIEQERKVALLDLLNENHFRPLRAPADGYAGPYKVALRVEEGRLAIAINRQDGSLVETIDMARRGVHNDAAELLRERLDGKIELDFDTARRLFTLICVLHIRG